ncbi:uncharacterized protein [Aristolochia californica]|uniref:uncharacterized protein isoform X2 n=1 Tax=Aristolochia californica TaxID=171875 RepID=UPI0035DA5606
MDFSRGADIPQHYQVQSNPHPSASSYAPHFYNAQEPYSTYQYSIPNSNPADSSQFPARREISIKYEPLSPIADGGLRQPGIYSSHVPNSSTGLDGHSLPYSGHHQVLPPAAGGSYYYDSNAQRWGVKEVIRNYGVEPYAYASQTAGLSNGTEQVVGSNLNAMHWGNSRWRPGANPYAKVTKHPKKTKIVQSAWCEICKIDCNSREVLDQHKMGKKHRKNIEKVEEMRTNANVAVAGNRKVLTSADERQLQGTIRKEAPASEPADDLETKKRKLLEGGAAPEAVRVCEVCNVACNSEVVFKYHLAGQKHAAQLRKQAAAGPAVVAT